MLRSLEAIVCDVTNGGREKSVWAREGGGEEETDVDERKELWVATTTAAKKTVVTHSRLCKLPSDARTPNRPKYPPATATCSPRRRTAHTVRL